MLRRAVLAAGLWLAALGSASAAEPVKAIGPEQFQAVLAAETGKLVVVNLWATWCAPCLVEIPDLMKLEKDLAELNVKLIGVSVDDPRGTTAAIGAMRDKRFPGFNTYARDKGELDALISVVDPAWNEVVPTTYVLGRDGTVKTRIQGKKSLDEFKAAVKAAAE
jgi:thiol-disulfide isomerase/thioredoxin